MYLNWRTFWPSESDAINWTVLITRQSLRPFQVTVQLLSHLPASHREWSPWGDTINLWHSSLSLWYFEGFKLSNCLCNATEESKDQAVDPHSLSHLSTGGGYRGRLSSGEGVQCQRVIKSSIFHLLFRVGGSWEETIKRCNWGLTGWNF